MPRIHLLLLVLLFTSSIIWGQTQKKQTTAIRISEDMTIDGKLDEAVWDYGVVATDFVQLEPTSGIPPTFQSEVKILYDDNAIYVGAMLLDNEPDKILKELSERDQRQNTDWFGVTFDTYKDGLNAFAFMVTAAGVQLDVRFSADGEDGNWDAVWESDVNINADGWSVEMKIPYSAIRFPNKPVQEWQIQFLREIRRFREESFWNEIDPEVDGFVNQSGILNGIKDIKSPVRLSITPFIAGYLNTSLDPKDSDKWSGGTAYNAGMDLKYGINDAFTLDMTLIPDFGQTISDQQVLNLSPFEVFFEENRAFFTEGLELFSKGNLFYSRRVGGAPLNRSRVNNEVQEDETIVDNPSMVQLYNATKVTGRSASGMGVGFFNAVAGEEYAVLRNAFGQERRVQTNPLTNYNIVVIDQNLRNNSYVSFINTNVLRNGSDYDANVTGTQFNLRNKAQSYEVGGKVAISQKYFTEESDIGHTYLLYVNKTSGKWNGGVSYNEESANYDPNDLGFLFSPNERSVGASIDYNEYNPGGSLDRYEFGLSLDYQRLQDPNKFTDFAINFNQFTIYKSRNAFGSFHRIEPVETFDYFEPRTSDFSRYFTFPTNYTFDAFVSTDYRKTFALDASILYRVFNEDGRYNVRFRLSPRVRINNKISFITSAALLKRYNDPGYTASGQDAFDQFGISELSGDDIMFGIRDRTILENSISGKYIFTNRMSLIMRIRHYWDKVLYQKFGLLTEDGYISPIDYNGLNEAGQPQFDRNFNYFTVDMQYTWRFAPGSDLIFVWKNEVSNLDNEYDRNYFENFSGLFNTLQFNNFSLRLVYFLDYLYLKK